MLSARMAVPTTLPSRRALLSLAVGGALPAALPACSLPTRLAAVPRGRASAATVVGVPNERFFPLEPTGQAALQREFVAAVERRLVSRGLPPTAPLPDLDLLGVSGGVRTAPLAPACSMAGRSAATAPAFSLSRGSALVH